MVFLWSLFVNTAGLVCRYVGVNFFIGRQSKNYNMKTSCHVIKIFGKNRDISIFS